MYKPDHITTVKTVKISANQSLKACERIIFADGQPVKVADIAIHLLEALETGEAERTAGMVATVED